MCACAPLIITFALERTSWIELPHNIELSFWGGRFKSYLFKQLLLVDEKYLKCTLELKLATLVLILRGMAGPRTEKTGRGRSLRFSWFVSPRMGQSSHKQRHGQHSPWTFNMVNTRENLHEPGRELSMLAALTHNLVLAIGCLHQN